MGSAQSSVIKKREVAGLDPTSSTDVGSGDNDSSNTNKWVNIIESDSSEEECEDAYVDDERLVVLEESRNLKMLAEFFLHPEQPVRSEPASCGRCYFDRPAAPVQETEEDAEEAARVLQDLKALKKLAVDFQHPELPVETSDVTALCALLL